MTKQSTLNDIHRILRSIERVRQSLYNNYGHLIDDTLVFNVGTTSDRMHAKYEDRIRRTMKSISKEEEFLSDLSRDLNNAISRYNAEHEHVMHITKEHLEKNRQIIA